MPSLIKSKKMQITEYPNFDLLEGHVPAVIQDYETGEVLMIGYMNPEAWEATIFTKKVHYYSRKKRRIWLKGEQSGHYQFVKQVFMNCDRTSLLIKVEQIKGACDLGFKSCFYRTLEDGQWVTVETRVFNPQDAYGKNFSENITLGIPSGSLEKMTFNLLRLAGYEIERESDRLYQPVVENEPTIKLLMARANELPTLVAQGDLDAAITGIDVVMETGNTVRIVSDLGYNKLGLGPVVLAFAAPVEKKIQHLADLENARIATAYPHLTQKFLHQNAISVEKIIPSMGATEGKVPLIADIIVDLVETGATLKANGLKPLWGICETTVHFITSNEAWGYTWKRRSMEKIANKLEEAARKLPRNPKKLLELNVLSSCKSVSKA